MMNSSERLNYIAEYLTGYENKIKTLNSRGLYDAAKMFELFALEVCKLWFGVSFKNLNKTKPNFPFVDLVSEDGTIYCQVSTCENVPQKIKETLTKLANSNDDNVKKINSLYFFVLNNDSVDRVKGYVGENRIGRFEFHKGKHLITTATILAEAESNLNFQLNLYDLFKKESDLTREGLARYERSLKESSVKLSDVRDSINDKYQIDLSEQIKAIDLEAKVVFVTGEAGSGKTALCKKLLEKETNVLFVRSEQIVSANNIDDIFGFAIEDIFPLVKSQVYICVDALEHISDCPVNLDNLKSLFGRIEKIDNAHIVVSCRSSEISRFEELLAKFGAVIYSTRPISSEELQKIVKVIPNLKRFAEDPRYRCLTTNPFYLHFLSTVSGLNFAEGVSEVRRQMWEKVICAGELGYAPTIKKIALDRAKEFSVGVSPDDYSSPDSDCINALLQKDVLMQDDETRLIRLKYDIFEDICFEQYIDDLFRKSKGNFDIFSKSLSGMGRCSYRRYQIWVENKLFAMEDCETLIYDLVFGDVPSSLKEQTRIGIIKSNYCTTFFEKYGDDLVERGDLADFIRLTNIYGFSISGTGYPDNMQLKPCGVGRSCLIQLAAKHMSLWEDKDYLPDVEKMVFDHSKGDSLDDAGEYSCKILMRFLQKYEEKDSGGDAFYSYQEIKKYVKALFRLNAYCKPWISDFINLIRQDLASERRAVHEFANEAIKDIIQENGRYIVEWASRDIYDLMDLFFCGKIRDDTYSYYRGPDDDEFKYGFNGNAEYFRFDTGNSVELSTLRTLFKNSYLETLGWLIGFANKAVDVYRLNNKLNQYELNFVDTQTKKTYFGTADMWFVGEASTLLPPFLNAVFYCAKFVLREIFQKNPDLEFATKVKTAIFDKSNNVMCLSILNNAGLAFENNIPGLCLDFASNLDLVLTDLYRTSRYTSVFNNKYKGAQVQNDLGNYVLRLQLNNPELRTKCFKILDYLYSTAGDDKRPVEQSMQIRCMDLRAYTKESRGALLPSLDAEAEKLVNEAAQKGRESKALYAAIEETKTKIGNGSATFRDIDFCIRAITNAIASGVLPASILNASSLEILSLALSKVELSREKKDEYCAQWVNVYQEEKYLPCDSKKSIQIYSAIIKSITDEDVSDEVKNSIKFLVLKKLNTDNRAIGPEIDSDFLTAFLRCALVDKKIAKMFETTILMLAKDEMSHQRYNAEYYKKFREAGQEFVFRPNLQPKLSGVDRYIEYDEGVPYSFQRDQIVEKYLIEESAADFSDFNIDDYDIGLVSRLFLCGINVNDPLICEISRQYVECCIRIFAMRGGGRGAPRVLIPYEQEYARNFFERNFKSKETCDTILSIFFDDKNYEDFTEDTVKFYSGVFNTLTAFYFDAYVDREKRRFIEELIGKLEERINAIPVEWAKQRLFAALILSINDADRRSNWAKCKTKYEQRDIEFLCKQFEKYGCYNLNDLAWVLVKLRYSELLPRVLVSLNESVSKYFQDNNGIVHYELTERTIEIIEAVLFYAFSKKEVQIKNNEKFTKAYEHLLEVLTDKYQNPSTAVLLDEFRIH